MEHIRLQEPLGIPYINNSIRQLTKNETPNTRTCYILLLSRAYFTGPGSGFSYGPNFIYSVSNMCISLSGYSIAFRVKIGWMQCYLHSYPLHFEKSNCYNQNGQMCPVCNKNKNKNKNIYCISSTLSCTIFY